MLCFNWKTKIFKLNLVSYYEIRQILFVLSRRNSTIIINLKNNI